MTAARLRGVTPLPLADSTGEITAFDVLVSSGGHGNQPAHQSLITDVFRSCPPLCTIHHLINFTLARVENVPVVPAVLDQGHQSKVKASRYGGCG